MVDVLKTSADAAYGAAGKIYSGYGKSDAGGRAERIGRPQRDGRKDNLEIPAKRTCPACGAELEDGATFCGECGAAV